MPPTTLLYFAVTTRSHWLQEKSTSLNHSISSAFKVTALSFHQSCRRTCCWHSSPTAVCTLPPTEIISWKSAVEHTVVITCQKGAPNRIKFQTTWADQLRPTMLVLSTHTRVSWNSISQANEQFVWNMTTSDVSQTLAQQAQKRAFMDRIVNLKGRAYWNCWESRQEEESERTVM